MTRSPVGSLALHARWLFGLSLLATGCPGDDVPTTTNADSDTDTDNESSSSGTTTNGPTTDTDGPTTDSTGADSTGADSTGSDSTGADSTGPGVMCGDTMVGGDEVCDGDDLDGEDCMSQGFDEGTLACADDCAGFDTSACVMYSCGNDMLEGMEVCDGADLDGEDCVSQGFDEGTLGCADDCMGFDTSACVMYSCGNDLLEGMEVCDGAALDGEDCVSQGFDEGTLGCAADCMGFDTSLCVDYVCGNDMLEGAEVCDGADLDGETCATQGFDEGALGCAADCSAFDPSACTSCGDGMAEGMEVCDGADLAGETCASQGFGSGVLACDAACGAYDPAGCCDGDDIGSLVGFGVALGTTAGAGDDQELSCDGTPGEDVVLFWTAPATQTFTLDTTGSDFDTVLAVLDDCGGSELACNDQAFFSNQSSVTLDAVAGTTYAIVIEGWDTATGNYQLNISESFGACIDTELGSELGAPLQGADDIGNAGEGDDTIGSCAGGNPGEDVAYSWIAPATGTFQIDTFGSDYDTILYVLDGCGGNELVCNDEAAMTNQSAVTMAATAGVPYVIVVDAWNNDVGLHDLSIQPVAGVCTDLDLGGLTGNGIVTGGNAGLIDDTLGSCGGGTPGEDAVIQWTAPFTGDVVIDTFGSDYDTVLYVLDGCGGAELACNDDGLGGTVIQSDVTLSVTAGTTYQIVIDAWNNAAGSIQLNINPPLPACADGNIFGLAGNPIVGGTNAGSVDDLQGSCSATPGEELVAQWVAPATGTFTIDTFGSDYDTVLYVLDGCGGAELACNDDAGGPQSQLVFDAVVGTPYLIAIDARNNATGNFLLDIIGPY